MPKSESTVLIQCNRGGSVSAGPLTLHHGVNEVDVEQFEEFKKTKLGAALVKQKILTLAAQDIEPEPENTKESDAGDEDTTASTSDTPEDSSEEPAAPTLNLSAVDAIEFVKGLEDWDVLTACYEQDERKTVKAACNARAEELDKKPKDNDPEPEDSKPDNEPEGAMVFEDEE